MDLARNHVNCQLPEMIETSSLLVHSAPKNSPGNCSFQGKVSRPLHPIRTWEFTYDIWHMSRQSFFVTPMEPQISLKKTAKKFKEPWLVSHTSLTLACHENKTVMIASLTSLELLVLFYAPAMSMGFIQLCPSASLWLIAIIAAFLLSRHAMALKIQSGRRGDHHHHHHQQALLLGPQHLGDIRWQVPPPILLYPLHLRGWRSLVQSVALSCGRKPQLTTEVLTIPSEWLNSSSVVEGSSVYTLYHDL